jgi:2-polyprenyl-3-methyl-5-hydroxy-6-metoxy-1,4-benzoquinol methylase/uncharacterized protein YbaR (Trm112 family)
LDILCCPACGQQAWTLEVAQSETIADREGPRDEVRTGEVTCACGRQYPVREYVLSLAGLFPADLQREAAFWDRFYLWNLEHGAAGFHDLRRGFAPFMAQGVTEAFPHADTIDRYDVHYQVAEHPLLRAGQTLLDIGVGLGWTSIHFARSGYQVTAFDPSLGPVQAAKAYAIQEGLPIEYLCAAMGYIQFQPGSFDNVTAFHSLHHVPDLEAGLRDVRRWLRPGGALAVDEHIANSRLAGAVGAQLHQWAAENVFPRYRTISDADLARLPSEGHSALEDAGVDQVVPLLRRMFDVQFERQRHVVLDHYPLLYYLWKDKDETGFRHALEIANHFQELLRQVDPDGGEYLTLVAANPGPDVPGAETVSAPAEVMTLTPIYEDAPLPPAAEGLAIPAEVEAEIGRLQGRVAELERALAEQGAWARSLEAAQKARDRELARLRAHLRRVENGRVMRLLRLLKR